MAELHLTPEDWSKKKERYWPTFFNTISGPRSVVMIGTQDGAGISNIGLFNSLVHLGANPPLVGFILRPTTVARHTYENLKRNGCYTINHGLQSEVEAVHQTSAKYEADEDEFERCGWKKQAIAGFDAPFVAESVIKLGMRYVDEHLIPQNGTRLIVGRVEHVLIDEQFVEEDGFINTSAAETLISCGLDAYFKYESLKRLPYARP